MRTNYLAVLVAAIIYWLLGGVWFGALFSARWVALEHLSEEQMHSMSPVLPYVVTFLLNLLIAWALARLCAWRNAQTALGGAGVGILVWVGIVGPMTFTTSMYEMRPLALFAINELYGLVGLAIMGAILGAWTKKSA